MSSPTGTSWCCRPIAAQQYAALLCGVRWACRRPLAGSAGLLRRDLAGPSAVGPRGRARRSAPDQGRRPGAAAAAHPGPGRGHRPASPPRGDHPQRCTPAGVDARADARLVRGRPESWPVRSVAGRSTRDGRRCWWRRSNERLAPAQGQGLDEHAGQAHRRRRRPSGRRDHCQRSHVARRRGRLYGGPVADLRPAAPARRAAHGRAATSAASSRRWRPGSPTSLSDAQSAGISETIRLTSRGVPLITYVRPGLRTIHDFTQRPSRTRLGSAVAPRAPTWRADRR